MVQKYGEIIVDHLNNPRNYEALEGANGYVSFTGPCEDVMKIWIRVINNVIEEITFRSNGCEITRATGSVLTELVKGKKISEALKITPLHIESALGGLPEDHYHSAILVIDALHKVIENFEENNFM
ncbi:MAG: iron-sulfur cluster assembly scaffold protein [Clostridiaceae bacterium]